MDSPSKHVFDHIRFSEKLAHQFLCEVCLNPVLDAEIATPCGHSFCGFCVEQLKANGKTACQKCKQPVTAYIRNQFANDIIATVDGDCSWCQEKLKLDTAKQHVRQCQLLEKPCDLCHQPFKRRDLQQHVQECPFRDIVCACGTRIKKKEEENHVATTCAFKEESCPLNCGTTVKRVLIPTHSLRCSAVATECDVKGCNRIVRRGDVQTHISEDQMRHFKLLQEEKRNILWEVQKRVVIDLKTKSTGEVGVFQWNLPTRPRVLLCSPEFRKFDRTWRLLLDDKTVALEFSQGVKPIYMDLSFIVKSSDGKTHGYILRTVGLAEGTMATHTLKMPVDDVRTITAKLELLEPQMN